MGIKHAKTSAKTDGSDSALIQATDWNADHTATVRAAAGVPSGAPGSGELPFAADTTAVTGGLYF